MDSVEPDSLPEQQPDSAPAANTGRKQTPEALARFLEFHKALGPALVQNLNARVLAEQQESERQGPKVDR